MTRQDLLNTVRRLYQEVGENDWQLSQKIGISNKTVKRWRDGDPEEFRPTADNALRIAKAAALDPFEALTAVDLRDLADFLMVAARTHPATPSPYSAIQNDQEQFLISSYRQLVEQAPEEAAATIRLFESRMKSLNRDDATATRTRRPHRRRS